MAEKERQLSGMYNETPRVQIGEFSISRQDDANIWIEHASGEGGAFKEELLEAHIRIFYEKLF